MKPSRLTTAFLVLATGLTVTIAYLLWTRGDQAAQPDAASPAGAAAPVPRSASRPPAPGALLASSASPATPGAQLAASEPAAAPQAPALSEEARREAEAYPWDDFAEALGRELSTEERELVRDLRKEHGLRLAEARARMMRGLVPRAEFERWRDQRAAEFRSELQKALRCTPEEVTAMLSVKLRPSQP